MDLMQFKTKAFVVAVVVCAGAFTIWPACASKTLTTSRKPISSLKRADFVSVRNTRLSRDDVVSRFGRPDAYFPDLRVSCYKLNFLKRVNLVIIFGVPIAEKAPDLIELALIEFDAHDKVRRTVIKSGDFEYARNFAENWVAD